jgi:hypothetical protein
MWVEEENTYEDDVQEVGERVDDGDEEEGNQARDANLVSVNFIRGVRIWMWRRSSRRRDRLTMPSDRDYRVVACSAGRRRRRSRLGRCAVLLFSGC